MTDIDVSLGLITLKSGGSVIGACALVTAGTRIPPRSLVLGVPAKVVSTLSAADEAFHRALAAKYTRLAYNYEAG